MYTIIVHDYSIRRYIYFIFEYVPIYLSLIHISSEDALYGLLRFLMNHVLVPKKVWKCIVGYFDLEGRRSELAEQFPENYLDYITNNATYEDIINYEAFEHAEITTSATIDAYIRDYIELDRMVRSQELKDAGEKIRQMKEKYYISNVYIHLEEMRDVYKRQDIRTLLPG